MEIQYLVTMDTTVESAFNVDINNHTIVKFFEIRGLDGIYLILLSLINTQLSFTRFSPPLKRTNHVLVDVKLKERIELATYK